MAKKYRSRKVEALLKTAKSAQRGDAKDKKTMGDFDVACLTRVEVLSPKDIRSLRKREGVSQGVFAHYLNIKAKLVSEWERGEKKPSGPSLKLLALVKAKGLDAIA